MMGHDVYQDRQEAGRLLAAALEKYRDAQPIVLGIPRGGVVVAAEVARALNAPLDVVIARKIGAPQQPELAIGAVVSGDGIRLLDQRTIRYLNVPPEYIERETERQMEEIRRRIRYYRGERPFPDLHQRTVIVVDDGIATGYTVRAALAGLRRLDPERLVLAVPVAPPATCAQLDQVVDDLICLRQPDPFFAVGAWYVDFEQVEDEEVAEILREHAAWLAGQAVTEAH